MLLLTNGESSPEPLDTQHRGSLLLDLPPEIRNLIYEFATQENNICVARRFDVIYPFTFIWERESKRQFFGLTQVCRMVRQEFYPLYMSKISVQVYIRSLPALQRSPWWSRNVHPAITIGKFTINVCHVKFFHRGDSPAIDLFPLLSLILEAPKLEVTLRTRGYTRINCLANLRGNASWRQFFSTAVYKVEVTPESYHRRPLVCIMVKPPFKEDWMAGPEVWDYWEGLKDWIKKMGLDTYGYDLRACLPRNAMDYPPVSKRYVIQSNAF